MIFLLGFTCGIYCKFRKLLQKLRYFIYKVLKEGKALKYYLHIVIYKKIKNILINDAEIIRGKTNEK